MECGTYWEEVNTGRPALEGDVATQPLPSVLFVSQAP